MAKTVVQQIYAGIRSGDLALVRNLLQSHPSARQTGVTPASWLHHAAACGHIEVAAMLLELEFDINAYRLPETCTPLSDAITFNQLEMARYLLSRGADPNIGRILIGAINSRSEELAFEFVKLLVEYGIDVNRGFPFGGDDGPVFNGLTWAIANENQEIANYLRSVGAVEVDISSGQPDSTPLSDEVVAYFSEEFGEVRPVSLTEIVPSGLPIAIHVIPPTEARESTTLFTTGMSSQPMTVPTGGEDYRLAELFIELPGQWPLTHEALADPRWRWPIHWLRSIARYPHEQQTWLGGLATILSNGDPPEPLAPELPFTAILAVTQHDFVNRAGDKLQLYRLMPIYTEERELEAAQGVAALFQAFDRAGTPFVVDLNRPCVVA